MNRYYYDGPVLEFERCIANHYRASTCAVSEKKAKQNLAYRFKKETNRMPNAKITLPGKIIMVESEVG